MLKYMMTAKRMQVTNGKYMIGKSMVIVWWMYSIYKKEFAFSRHLFPAQDDNTDAIHGGDWTIKINKKKAD